MTRLTNALLKRAAAAAMKHADLGAQITEAFRERYGCTFSDVDADQVIDQLDYGLGGTPTVKECDAEMERCGTPALTGKDRTIPKPLPAYQRGEGEQNDPAI